MLPKSRYTQICGMALPPLWLPLDETITDDLSKTQTATHKKETIYLNLKASYV